MDPAEHERAERFSSIFGESYGRVHAYAARRVGTDSADDIAAETMLIAWRRRDVLPADPLPWLYGIARNVVARHHEAAARGQRPYSTQILFSTTYRPADFTSTGSPRSSTRNPMRFIFLARNCARGPSASPETFSIIPGNKQPCSM